MLEQLDEILEFANDVVSAGAIDDVVVLGMGGSSLAPEVMRRSFGAERFHVLDTTHPKAIRALESQIDVERTLFLSASKSGSTLETRSHTAYFLERGGAVRRDHRSRARSSRRSRGENGLPAASSTASRRSAGATRRCRRSGSCPAVLMGIDATRLLERAVEMREACRSSEGNPGPGARAARSAPAASVGARRSTRARFGLWVEQLIAESTGKQGKGHRAGARRPGRAELHEEVRARRPVRARPGVLPLGVRHRRRRLDPRHQPVRPARRAGGEGQDERGARERATSSSSRRVARRAARAGAATATTSASRRSSTPRARTSVAAARRSCARERRTSSRTASGRATCTRPASCTRAGRTPGLFLQVVDDHGDELPIPGSAFGFARLIRAQAAGDYESLKERGRRVVRVRLEDRDAARNDRPRPHGRQHDDPPRREHGHDVKTYDPGVERARPRRSPSSATSSTRRARSG